MKLHYYPETDSLYVELRPDPSTETRELQEGLNMDLSADGRIVGFDIDQATQVMDLSIFEMTGLPFHSLRSLPATTA
jgi:uncharacterized protein YuzE